MSEWGIPFHVIENEWTDRQFALMLARLTERKKRQAEAQGKGKGGGSKSVPYC